jgi:hypothetical protein
MTTPLAAKLYEIRHLRYYEGRGWAVFNPQNKPEQDLPVIYGFNNGGSRDWWTAQLISEDGMGLGSHICSFETYMPSDLGILEGTRPDRHKSFQEYYPDGYRMEFVSSAETDAHKGLQKALEKGKERDEAEALSSRTGIKMAVASGECGDGGGSREMR